MSTKPDTTLLERIRRSGLVARDALVPLWQRLETQGVDLADDKAVADTLVLWEVLTDWQAKNLREGKYTGFFFSSYRLLRPLGGGPVSVVLLARHEMMEKLCAIKLLPYCKTKQDSSVLKQFYVQLQGLAAMDHPNIVRAYDLSAVIKQGKEIHYLVMEFVDGSDLQTMVRDKGVLDYVRATKYLRQTAEALSYMHEAGLMHRSIQPANLMVDKKGVVKIVGFGRAAFLADSSHVSPTMANSETPPGTADCLSAEPALSGHIVDPREDIYALGCTAYFLLTGQSPIRAGTQSERSAVNRLEVPQPIQDIRPDAPPGLIAIIEKMMAQQPDERVQTAAEIATLLTDWLLEHGDDQWKRQHRTEVADEPLFASLSCDDPFQHDS